MKITNRILRAMAAAMALALVGCAGALKETGVLNATEENIQALKKESIKTIYVKAALFEAGWTRWTMVSDTPEFQPDDSLLKFKEIVLDEIIGIMKKKGYSLVETKNNPGDAAFFEMRMAAREKGLTIAGTIATRLYFFHPLLKVPVEIYNWDRSSFFDLGMGPIDEKAVRKLARKTADDLLRVLGK